MAMHKAFTGGACAPGGEGQSMGNNAFTNMLDQMITGGASAQQKAEGFGAQISHEHMSAMEAAYEEQHKFNQMASQFDNMQVNAPYPSHHDPMMEVSNPNTAQMNDLWNQPHKSFEDVQTTNLESNFSQFPNQSSMFGIPGMMGPSYMPPMNSHYSQINRMNQQNIQNVPKVEEIEEVKSENQQVPNNELKDVAGSFAQCLEQIPDDKMKNSEFVSFLKKLSTGVLEIDDNGISEDSKKLTRFEEAQANQKAMEEAYRLAQLDQFIEESNDPERYSYMEDTSAGQEMQNKFDEELKQAFDPTSLFRDIWDAGEMKEDELQTMMANWKMHAEKNQEYYNETLKEQPLETIISVEKKDLFKFDEENPYKEHDDAYNLAWQLNEDLKVRDAIQALQANLQKNPGHAQSWRLLGQLYQENDQDDRAIAYFQKAYDLDPYDLESLLCLGVSWTNELQESVAMRHLLNWLKYNPEYCDLSFPDVDINDVNQLREVLKDLFVMASNKNPNDTDVLVCLGVIEFGERNFQLAAEFFGKAIKENPTDYNLWNKFGAGLANGFRNDEALEIYGQTLELRPNLVRTWANIGIAYSNKDQFDVAAWKFMNALALNPDAEHIWEYLYNCFWAMKKYDKCELVKKRNIELFKDEYDIINPEMLPKPSMEELFNHPHLAS